MKISLNKINCDKFKDRDFKNLVGDGYNNDTINCTEWVANHLRNKVNSCLLIYVSSPRIFEIHDLNGNRIECIDDLFYSGGSYRSGSEFTNFFNMISYLRDDLRIKLKDDSLYKTLSGNTAEQFLKSIVDGRSKAKYISSFMYGLGGVDYNDVDRVENELDEVIGDFIKKPNIIFTVG